MNVTISILYLITYNNFKVCDSLEGAKITLESTSVVVRPQTILQWMSALHKINKLIIIKKIYLTMSKFIDRRIAWYHGLNQMSSMFSLGLSYWERNLHTGREHELCYSKQSPNIICCWGRKPLPVRNGNWDFYTRYCHHKYDKSIYLVKFYLRVSLSHLGIEYFRE